jgi:hypothetical protein
MENPKQLVQEIVNIRPQDAKHSSNRSHPLGRLPDFPNRCRARLMLRAKPVFHGAPVTALAGCSKVKART